MKQQNTLTAAIKTIWQYMCKHMYQKKKIFQKWTLKYMKAQYIIKMTFQITNKKIGYLMTVFRQLISMKEQLNPHLTPHKSTKLPHFTDQSAKYKNQNYKSSEQEDSGQVALGICIATQ